MDGVSYPKPAGAVAAQAHVRPADGQPRCGGRNAVS